MLHYKRNGQSTGKTLIMLHGFLGGHTIFNKVTHELQAYYDVVQIDLPGHGQSEMALTGDTIDDYVKAIVEVLDHEKITNSTWLGHSMGGYITLAALETKAAQIDQVILAYSSASPDSSETKKKRDDQRAKIKQDGVQAFVDGSIAGFFADDASVEDIDYARQIGYEASKDGLLTALLAMKTRRDQRDFVNHTSTPILVLEGAFDKAMTPIETDNIAVQKVVTQTGHIGMLEDAKAFSKAIRQFLG